MNGEQSASTTHEQIAVMSEKGWPHGPTAFEQRYGNMVTRVVVAIIAIPIFIYAIVQGGLPFFCLVAAIATGALLEFYWLLEKGGSKPFKLLGVIAGLMLIMSFLPDVAELLVLPIVTAQLSNEVARELYAQIVLMLGLLILLTTIALGGGMLRKKGNPILDIPATVSGVLYISLSLATLIGFQWLYRIEDLIGYSTADMHSPVEKAQWLVLTILIGIWICDSAAYFAGKSFGKHKLAPSISPKKTWEGAVAGVLFAVLAVIGMQQWLLDYLTLDHAIVIGVIVGVFGQLGDLAESQLKRSAGIKDSSQLIPGHGGVLDRFDSLLWVSPLVFLYLAFCVILR